MVSCWAGWLICLSVHISENVENNYTKPFEFSFQMHIVDDEPLIVVKRDFEESENSKWGQRLQSCWGKINDERLPMHSHIMFHVFQWSFTLMLFFYWVQFVLNVCRVIINDLVLSWQSTVLTSLALLDLQVRGWSVHLLTSMCRCRSAVNDKDGEQRLTPWSSGKADRADFFFFDDDAEFLTMFSVLW